MPDAKTEALAERKDLHDGRSLWAESIGTHLRTRRTFKQPSAEFAVVGGGSPGSLDLCLMSTPQVVTMSSKSSVPQAARFDSHALMSDSDTSAAAYTSFTGVFSVSTFAMTTSTSVTEHPSCSNSCGRGCRKCKCDDREGCEAWFDGVTFVKAEQSSVCDIQTCRPWLGSFNEFETRDAKLEK